MPGKRDRTKRLDEIRIKLISTYKKQLIIFAEILENYNIAKNKFEKNHGEDIFDWPPVSEIRLEILNLKKRNTSIKNNITEITIYDSGDFSLIISG